MFGEGLEHNKVPQDGLDLDSERVTLTSGFLGHCAKSLMTQVAKSAWAATNSTDANDPVLSDWPHVSHTGSPVGPSSSQAGAAFEL